MLQGFYGSHRQMTMGSNGRGHLDPQAIMWSRSLRGTYDNTVKKLRKEMEAKRRDRLLRRNSEPEAAATPSCSHRETPPTPRRPKSAEVQGAKQLLRLLHLDHMLSDVEDADVAKPKKKMLKLKGSRRPSIKKLRPKAAASSPVKRDDEVLTSWRMDASLPKRNHVTMSSQKTVKEPAVTSEEEEEEEDEEAPVTQWRYKPLPGEQEPRNPSARRSSERRDFDLDELRIVVVAMQKEHQQCIRSVAESLEHHTRQIVLLTKANSSLADHVESMEKEMKVLRAMQFVCTTIP